MSCSVSAKLVYFSAFALSALAHANLVVSNPAGGQWFSPVTATEASGAFWDQKSKDGSQCNIGFWLQQTTSWNGGVGTRCTSDAFVNGDNGPGELAFFAGAGDPSGGAATGWSFAASGPNILTLRLEVAGTRSTNTFGWLRNGVDQGLIYTGPDSPQTTKTLTAKQNDNIVFYICPAGNCANAFYSDTEVGGASDRKAGKFALFSEVPKNPTASTNLRKYWIGVEDRDSALSGIEGRGDYNDFVISASVVPEPGFYGALSVGLGALFMFARRRR